jgi:hypothetical protein
LLALPFNQAFSFWQYILSNTCQISGVHPRRFTIELLDSASPWDPYNTHLKREKATKKGTPLPDQLQFVAEADASTEAGHIRYFRAATDEPQQLRITSLHEYAHLGQAKRPFRAFPEAVEAEKNGLIVDPYAEWHANENWAVHFERWLNGNGAKFLQIANDAPARALLMAKAVEHMLKEQPEEKRSPKYEEYLDRVTNSETIAGASLRKRISDAMGRGDPEVLEKDLRFLNAAATSAHSPEILSAVIDPIAAELKACNGGGRDKDFALLMNDVYKSHGDYSPQLVRAVKNFIATDSTDLGVLAFQSLSKQGRLTVLAEVVRNPELGLYFFLTELRQTPDTQIRNMATTAFEASLAKLVPKAIAERKNDAHSESVYDDWLLASNRPEARLAYLLAYGKKDNIDFERAISGMSGDALVDILAGGGLNSVGDRYRYESLSSVLNGLSLNQEIDLFHALSQKLDPKFQNLADQLTQSADEIFPHTRERILAAATEIFTKQANHPDFVLSHPELIRTIQEARATIDHLSENDTVRFIHEGGLRNLPFLARESALRYASEHVGDRGELELLARIPLDAESSVRVEHLRELARNPDKQISDSAKVLLDKVVEAQMPKLMNRDLQTERPDEKDYHDAKEGYSLDNDRALFRELREALLCSSKSESRLRYLSALTKAGVESEGSPVSEFLRASSDLSETELSRFLEAGALHYLSASDRTIVLEALMNTSDSFRRSAQALNLKRLEDGRTAEPSEGEGAKNRLAANSNLTDSLFAPTDPVSDFSRIRSTEEKLSAREPHKAVDIARDPKQLERKPETDYGISNRGLGKDASRVSRSAREFGGRLAGVGVVAESVEEPVVETLARILKGKH